MADTTFTAQTTKILAAWLNDVNAQTYKNVVNVKMATYGALGDGTTSDQTAIQAAITAVTATGGIVYFPRSSGKYIITTALTVPANVWLVGAGKTASVIKSTNSAASNILAVSGDRAGVSNLGLEGVAGGGDGISIAANVGYFNAEHVRIVSAQRGVVFLNGNYLATLKQVEAVTCRSYGFYAVSAATVHNLLRFEECFANTCSDTGYFINNCTAFSMNDCASDTNTNYGYNFSAAYGTLTSCDAEVNTLRGFTVTSTGNVVFIMCRTYSQLLPFTVYGAARTTLINPQTSSTPSGNSLEYNSSATAPNFLFSPEFDAGVFVDPAAVVIQHSTIGLQFAGASIQEAQGASVAAANNLSLVGKGNYFQISGATQINLLSSSVWQGGAVVTLKFNSTPTVKHNQVVSGANKPIILNGAADLVAAASNTLTLRYDSTDSVWYEMARKV